MLPHKLCTNQTGQPYLKHLKLFIDRLGLFFFNLEFNRTSNDVWLEECQGLQGTGDRAVTVSDMVSPLGSLLPSVSYLWEPLAPGCNFSSSPSLLRKFISKRWRVEK